jgi:hypothetical protein
MDDEFSYPPETILGAFMVLDFLGCTNRSLDGVLEHVDEDDWELVIDTLNDLTNVPEHFLHAIWRAGYPDPDDGYFITENWFIWVALFRARPEFVLGKIKNAVRVTNNSNYNLAQIYIYLCYVLLTMREELKLTQETCDKLRKYYVLLYAFGRDIRLPSFALADTGAFNIQRITFPQELIDLSGIVEFLNKKFAPSQADQADQANQADQDDE